MTNNGLLETVPVPQQIGDWLIQELEQASPAEREYLIGVPVAVRQKTTFRTGCVVSAPTAADR